MILSKNKILFSWINEVGDKPGNKLGDISMLNNTQIKVLSKIQAKIANFRQKYKSLPQHLIQCRI